VIGRKSQVRVIGEMAARKTQLLSTMRWLITLSPGSLILSALFIDLFAGRWGAYIRTPIDGLYLPDALLVLGVITALPLIGLLSALPQKILALFLVPALYVFARITQVIFIGIPSDPYLVIRDLAPFAYLALIPFIAVALSEFKFTALIWVLRAATLLNLVITFTQTIGLLTPFSSGLLGGEGVQVFLFRDDVQGAILGIGLISWGYWKDVTRGYRLVQFLFILAGLNLASRAALATWIFCMIVVMVRERKWFAYWKFVLMVLTGAVLLMAVSTLDSQKISNFSSQSISSKVISSGTFSDPGSLFGKPRATFDARLKTYEMVQQQIVKDSSWFLGAGPGTDILYEACTGIATAPLRTSTRYSDGGSLLLVLPKCPIDSSEAETTLRDPHNWILNLLLYHGIVGMLIFTLTLLIPMVVYRRTANAILPVIVISVYFVLGSASVIISAPFALLPISVLTAWLLTNSIRVSTKIKS
jgi:hypothetical protein